MARGAGALDVVLAVGFTVGLAGTDAFGRASAVKLSPRTRSTEESLRASGVALAPLTSARTSLAFAAPDLP